MDIYDMSYAYRLHYTWVMNTYELWYYILVKAVENHRIIMNVLNAL